MVVAAMLPGTMSRSPDLSAKSPARGLRSIDALSSSAARPATWRTLRAAESMSRLSIHELILCPLFKCYPAPMPKPRYHTPKGLADMVRDARIRARRKAIERGRWREVRA